MTSDDEGPSATQISRRRTRSALPRLSTVADPLIDSLFYAAIKATEEAMVNSLVATETMTGGDDVVAHDELVTLMQTERRS